MNDDQRITDRRAGDAIDARLNRHADMIREVEARVTIYVERILAEKDRATELASHERDQASTALRKHQEDVVRATEANLRSHIHEQVEQIQAAIQAEAKLSEQRDAAIREQIGLTLQATTEASGKSERANEKRFDGFNDFRGQFADQAARFPVREVVDAQVAALHTRIGANHEALDERVAALTGRVDKAEGRQGGVSASLGLLVAGLGIVLSAVIVTVNVAT